MSSLNGALVRKALAQDTIGEVVDNTPVALRIAHPGDEAVTSVTVNVGVSIVLIDADATTTIDITAAATDHLGEISDYINSLTNWSCKVLDGLRSDDVSGNQLADGAITASIVNGETVWDSLVDTSVQLAMTYRCTNNRNVSISKPGAHRVSVKEIVYYATINGATANGIQVWEWSAKDKTETQRMRRVSVNTTETTLTLGGDTGQIDGAWGNDLIVRIYNAVSMTDADDNYLDVSYTRE